MMRQHTFLVRRTPPNIWQLVYEESDWTPQDVENETLDAYVEPWPGNKPKYRPLYVKIFKSRFTGLSRCSWQSR
jgi:hypothetical protein